MLEGFSTRLHWLLQCPWLRGSTVTLITVHLAALALFLAAILVLRFRYRKKIICMRSMARVEASGAAEDLSSAMLVVFTD